MSKLLFPAFLIVLVLFSGCPQPTGEVVLGSKSHCPHECCEGIGQYSDKTCAQGASCVDNKCVDEEIEETENEQTTSEDDEEEEEEPQEPNIDLCEGVECDDSNPCTEDSCSEGTCTHSNLSDEVSCGTNKECVGGECVETELESTPSCPSSCDDGDLCTDDYCSAQTNYECEHDVITPCCGNGLCETGETYNTCASDCEESPPTCTESCDDGNPCTDDYCNQDTDYQCAHSNLNGEITGCSGSAGTCEINTCVNGTCQIQTESDCCGNGECEYWESHFTCPEDCECTPNWTCTDWSECSQSGQQTRTCYDYAFCGTEEGKPAESQSCTPPGGGEWEEIIINSDPEQMLPTLSDMPTEYEEGETTDISISNEGFVGGKRRAFDKIGTIYYSTAELFTVDFLVYKFSTIDNAKSFYNEEVNEIKQGGGYTEVTVPTNSVCFAYKQDYGFEVKIAESYCGRGNVVFVTSTTTSNSFSSIDTLIKEMAQIFESRIA